MLVLLIASTVSFFSSTTRIPLMPTTKKTNLGTQIRVYGSNNLRNDSGVLDPTWECFVDHISIGATTPFAFPENNWLFCAQTTLVDGPHLLTVNATVMKSQTFWFDQIQYVPSTTVPLENKTVLIDNGSPQVLSAFGQGWQALGGTANYTAQTNSAFTFNFTGKSHQSLLFAVVLMSYGGVSLSWYGFIPTEWPHAATTSTYSVDGETPVNFLLQGLPANSGTVYNQKFFETKQYAQGNHQIVVLFKGNNTTTPLTLDYLVIQNGTTPQNTTTSSPPANSLNQNKAKSNTGAIVGGVVGGLVLIVLAVLGFLYIRRRERRVLSLDEKGKKPSDLTPQPFIYSPVSMETSILDGYAKSSGEQVPANMTNGGRGHNQMPSFSTSNFSQSVDPPSTGAPSTFASTAASAGHQAMSSISTRRELPGALAYASASSGNLSSPRSEKERLEAEATAAALRPVRRNDGGLPSPPTSGASASSSRLVVHQDSGIRLPSDMATDVEEIPPQYTAG
jgi:hypothetical protein